MNNNCTVAEAQLLSEKLSKDIAALCNAYTEATGVLVGINVQQHYTLGRNFVNYNCIVDIEGFV